LFQGTTALTLDAKGRLAIPARHREALASASGGALVMTAHPHGCLLLFPQATWAPISAQVLKASSFDRAAAAVKRTLIGYAVDMEMDAAGRLLVAPEMREYAGIDKSVRFVGMGSHFEIWSDEGWKRQNETALAALAGGEPPAGFEGISL
jgi:MraZ protein